MAQMNKKAPAIKTHEGGVAKRINPVQSLRRSVMSCMLWEDTFYEDGESVADRITRLVSEVSTVDAAAIAIEARNKFYLRHVPLHIAVAMCRDKEHRSVVAWVLENIIQRPDEITEFLSLYWADGKVPLAAQAKKGLARAFKKFSAYSLAKYNRDNAVKLRDALFLCHAKPKDKEQEEVWKKLVDGTLEVPDTWEVAISAAKKGEVRDTWTRLLNEKKLGPLALLRNLRNLKENGVDESNVKKALREMKADKVLPFRFIAAARHNPTLESDIESAMLQCMNGMEKIPGKTALVIDVSGSMEDRLSGKSDITRLDAACGLAILCRELCEDVEIYTFSTSVATIPNRRGFALRDAITTSQPHGGTALAASLEFIFTGNTGYRRIKDDVRNGFNPSKATRLIVITDEQSSDGIYSPACAKDKYVINVAAYKNGVGYYDYLHVDGFSESCIMFVNELEKEKRMALDGVTSMDEKNTPSVCSSVYVD